MLTSSRREPSREREEPPLVVADPGSRSRRWWVAAVVATLVAAVIVRFVARSHLWLDEALAVHIAQLPLGDIPEALRQDGAPPLYPFLLHVWMRLFGTGELAVRALSGLFAVAALPLMWLAGKRLGGRRVAWAALLLLATSPFAVHYATEARMYSLMVLLVLVGYLGLGDLLERFSWPVAILVAVSTALLLLTHYWSFYLLTMAVVLVGLRAMTGPRPREARRALWALVAGVVLFLPWAPWFIYQLGHTGTPWGGRPGPGAVFDTVTRFAGGPADPGFALSLAFYALVALALFGRAVDGRRVELDLRSRPPGRHLAAIVFGTVGLAIVIGALTESAYAVRYAAVVAPLFLLLVALGTEVFADPRVWRGVVAVLSVLGLVSIPPNMFGERTTAPKVAAAIVAGARPGDVVAYCPDQVAPSVTRLLPEGLVELTFPDGSAPDRIDWVDYEARNRAGRTAPFAEMLLARAGPSHDIWLVWAPGYRTFGTKCTALVERLEAARPDNARVVKVKPKIFEHPGVVRYRAPG